MRSRTAHVVAAVVLSSACLSLIACAKQAPAPETTHPSSAAASSTSSATSGVSPTDVAALRDALAASGFDVTASRPATGGIFPRLAQYFKLTVNSSPVEVYRFPTSQEASIAASQVSADGTSLVTESGWSAVEWKDRPHFFRRERLIVLYFSHQDPSSSVESNETMILGFLERHMGPQFAGQ